MNSLSSSKTPSDTDSHGSLARSSDFLASFVTSQRLKNRKRVRSALPAPQNKMKYRLTGHQRTGKQRPIWETGTGRCAHRPGKSDASDDICLLFVL